ncbi:MAG: futalosine hydrolase [Bacteroidota bacterium]
MKLLLISATEMEISPLLQHLQQSWQSPSAHIFKNHAHEVHVCHTGVGLVAATYAVTKALLAGTYDLVLQAGVAGSFDSALPLGSLVFITSEQYGDLGAEDHDEHLDIFDIGLLQKDVYPFTGTSLVTPLLPVHSRITLPQATGLTVNTVSGNAHTISRLIATYHCQVESLEGAAFHYACLQEQAPFAQIRAISNYVEPRDKSKWKMKEAVIALNNWLIDFIETA